MKEEINLRIHLLPVCGSWTRTWRGHYASTQITLFTHFLALKIYFLSQTVKQ
jgi:hypothetical protein